MERALGLARQGRLDEAIPMLEKLPYTASNVQQRIAMYMQRGTEQDLLKATDLLIQQQDLAPYSAEPYLKLAEIQWRTGHNNDALGLVISAGETEPGHARIDYYLAVAMQFTGRFDSALKAYRQTVLENADETLSEAELDIEASILAYETAAGYFPGSLHKDERKLVNAETEYNALQTALHNWQAGGPDLSTLSPGQVTRYGNAFYNLGTSDMFRYNCFHRAGEHFKACLAINPERLQARSNYLFLQNYNNISDEAISEMHIAEAAELRSQLGRPQGQFGNNPDPDKPLRVGYLSSDFRSTLITMNANVTTGPAKLNHWWMYCTRLHCLMTRRCSRK
jgi:tetratricopeptide (TPR) repeat protein